MRPSAPSSALTAAVRAWLAIGISTPSQRADAHAPHSDDAVQPITMPFDSVAAGYAARP